MDDKIEYLGKSFDRIIIEPEGGGEPIAVITREEIITATGFQSRLLPSKD